MNGFYFEDLVEVLAAGGQDEAVGLDSVTVDGEERYVGEGLVAHRRGYAGVQVGTERVPLQLVVLCYRVHSELTVRSKITQRM